MSTSPDPHTIRIRTLEVLIQVALEVHAVLSLRKAGHRLLETSLESGVWDLKVNGHTGVWVCAEWGDNEQR